MSYILIFTNESQQDLREGFAWYEEKRRRHLEKSNWRCLTHILTG